MGWAEIWAAMFEKGGHLEKGQKKSETKVLGMGPSGRQVVS